VYNSASYYIKKGKTIERWRHKTRGSKLHMQNDSQLPLKTGIKPVFFYSREENRNDLCIINVEKNPAFY
jgi:hypothetical protein